MKRVVHRKRRGQQVGGKHQDSEKKQRNEDWIGCDSVRQIVYKPETEKNQHRQNQQETKPRREHREAIVFALVSLLPAVFFLVVNSLHLVGQGVAHPGSVQVIEVPFNHKIKEDNGKDDIKQHFVHIWQFDITAKITNKAVGVDKWYKRSQKQSYIYR